MYTTNDFGKIEVNGMEIYRVQILKPNGEVHSNIDANAFLVPDVMNPKAMADSVVTRLNASKP